jgi:hypothetical protein
MRNVVEIKQGEPRFYLRKVMKEPTRRGMPTEIEWMLVLPGNTGRPPEIEPGKDTLSAVTEWATERGYHRFNLNDYWKGDWYAAPGYRTHIQTYEFYKYGAVPMPVAA